jgi:hypothetical protein
MQVQRLTGVSCCLWWDSHVGSEEQPGWYRVMDDLEFSLDIHELSQGAWQPFRCRFPPSYADRHAVGTTGRALRGRGKCLGECWRARRRAEDVQAEFVMLDPYVRATLSHDGKVRLTPSRTQEADAVVLALVRSVHARLSLTWD